MASPYYQGGKSSGGIYPGAFNMQSMFDQLSKWKPDENDDFGRGMKLTHAYNSLGKAQDAQLARAQAYDSAGLSMDMMTHASNLGRQEQSDARKEQFGYGMASMDKQYELQNQYANTQFTRDVNMLDASGAQYRKNLKEAGNQTRMNSIASGEQQRLGIAATGEQSRLQAITEGEQQRLGIAATGHQERRTMTHEERLMAAREKRHIDRARNQSRAF